MKHMKEKINTWYTLQNQPLFRMCALYTCCVAMTVCFVLLHYCLHICVCVWLQVQGHPKNQKPKAHGPLRKYFLLYLRYISDASQVQTLQATLNRSLSTTLHVYGHPTALLAETGTSPLYVTQNLQLAQFRFRLHSSPLNTIPHVLWQLWQPLLQVVSLDTLEYRMQTAICHVDLARRDPASPTQSCTLIVTTFCTGRVTLYFIVVSPCFPKLFSQPRDLTALDLFSAFWSVLQRFRYIMHLRDLCCCNNNHFSFLYSSKHAGSATAQRPHDLTPVCRLAAQAWLCCRRTNICSHTPSWKKPSQPCRKITTCEIRSPIAL